MSSFLIKVEHSAPVPEPPAKPALVKGHEPDRFQKFAIEAIERGDNILATCATGSGKTFIGEYQIAKSLQRGGRVFYTTPIKSLSNQKFHDLKELFPEASVGIYTGDIKFRPDAQILILTTECLRNMLFKKGTATEKIGSSSELSLDSLDAVVFDEVHYINDPDRGHVWEECLMLLPPEIHLILLSATLNSPELFAKWLGDLKQKPIWLISTLWRAVPLEHCVIGENNKLEVIYDSKEQFQTDVYRNWLAKRRGEQLAHDKFKEKVKDARRSGVEGSISGKVRPKDFIHEMNECLEDLEKKGNLPAIVFQFSRKGCETLASKVRHTFLDNNDCAVVKHIWDFHLSRYMDFLEKSPQYHTLRELACRGIAYHHSGLLPFLKEILEILFNKGYIKVLFATETFAVGINMPTKTVIFTNLDKYTDGTMRPLRTAEYIQMAGRAGRRGKDTRGIVIYLPQREPMEPYDLRAVVCGQGSTFSSRMTFHYDFVLKLANTEKENIYSSLIEKSYWYCLEIEARKQVEAELNTLKNRLKEPLLLTDEQKEECRMKEELEFQLVNPSGSLSQGKRKVIQKELQRWKDDHKSSIWDPLLARYNKRRDLEEEVVKLESIVSSFAADRESLLSSPVQERIRFLQLEECGYVDMDGRLSKSGRLATEINEGHPFLMTELFLRLCEYSKLVPEEQYSKSDILTILSLFLGESKEESNKPPEELDVPTKVRKEILKIYSDAKKFLDLEKEKDFEFWELSTEWVEIISEWVKEGSEETFGSVANVFGVFEGNVQKALMKLSNLVEEMEALATLTGELEILKLLEGSREIILRGSVLAESLYLRL
jgi:superfamily II RNA helicase